MKSLNKYTNLLNIITIIIIFITTAIVDFIIYKNALTFLQIIFYIVAVINIIVGIANLAKKNIKNGILQIILGLIMAFGFFIGQEKSSFGFFIFAGVMSIALSIVNIIINKNTENANNKVFLIIFIILTIIEVGTIIVPATMNFKNISNLENALSKLKQDEYIKTYTYETDDKKTVFIDENANIIAEKDYELAPYGIEIKIDNKTVKLGYAKTDNQVFIVNCKGDILFELCPNIIGGAEEGNDLASDFFTYIFSAKKFGITYTNVDLDFNEKRAYEFALYRYQMSDMTEYEDDITAEYMYFRNEGYNSDKIIQVELTNIPLANNKLADIYLENLDSADLTAENNNELSNNAYNLINKFYKQEKNYYLIDLEEEKRMKLDCENLIYSPYYDESNNLIERILLYTFGEIPFYDEDGTGYFDFSGKKYTIQNDYIVQDTSATFNIMLNKTNNRTYAVNKEVEQYILEYPYLKVYNNFYVIYDKNLNQYQILDKNLTFLTTSAEQEPIILGRNLFTCAQKNSDGMMQYNSYYFDGTQIKLIYSGSGMLNEFANKSVDNSDRYDDSIYSKMGIIYPSESSDETFVPDTK